MDCFYHFEAEEKKLRECPYGKIQELFDSELLHGEEGKKKFVEILNAQNDPLNIFTPPGELIDLYHKNGKNYQVTHF